MMNRPYVICHMVMSIDGKVTGDFLSTPECGKVTAAYYEINRNYKADAYACGRITMEGSFSGGWYPDLSGYAPVNSKDDFIPGNLTGFYAVAFDPKGRLGWKSDRIIDPDGDPGYDKAQIIEVLTEQADPKYLGYLQKTGIPYIFAGESEIDVELALEKLKKHFGINTLLLEGGSVINGYFERAGVIDEISIVIACVVAGEGLPIFGGSSFAPFTLAEIKNLGGAMWVRYVKKSVI